jgi:transposase-like protein
MHSVLSHKYYQNEAAAYAWVEARVWPQGPVCPHCGNVDARRITKAAGKTTRVGLYNCKECRKPFTVKIGTVFEASHVKMHLWLQAMFLMVSSKKGVSSNQLHRTLGVTLKTAWFMSYRLREAMRVVGIAPLGGKGQIVEVNETLMSKQEGAPRQIAKGYNFRNIVLTLVERGESARSFHIDGTTIGTLKPIITANITRETAMMTNQAAWYPEIGRRFASHDAANHSDEEYVRYEGHKLVSTNTVEGY